MNLKISLPLRHSIHIDNNFGQWWLREKTFFFENAVGFVVEARASGAECWGFDDPNSAMSQLDYYLRSSHSNKFLEYFFENPLV